MENDKELVKVHNIHDDETHEMYKEDELIAVRLPVKDVKVLRSIIQREKSMSIVWKYVLSFSGALITIVAGLQAVQWFGHK